jgi:saccharopine dehydrogenase-like NADP-dependent oxidoreductase
MKIGIIGAGNIGQTLKAMLTSVDGVTLATLADNNGAGDVHVDVGTGENLATFVGQHDGIVNALPFYLNNTVAGACAEVGRCYFDSRKMSSPRPSSRSSPERLRNSSLSRSAGSRQEP